MSPGRRIKRMRKGGFDLRLPEPERQLVASLVGQLRGVLTADDVAADPGTRRLFPSAYADDPGRDEEYRAMVHDDLLTARLAALDVVEETVGASTLDEAQLLAWMGAVNDLRLVLGTRLEVTEETDLDPAVDDPHAQALQVYGWLGWLQESLLSCVVPRSGAG